MAATGQTETCSACNHFSPEADHCKVHDSQRSADAPACRFFDRREPG
jgi:hypothetical protein